jgi:hypothetical protein
MLEAVKATAAPWLWLERLWDHGRPRRRAGLGKPYAGSVGSSAVLEETAYRDVPRRTSRKKVDEEQRKREL